MSAPLVSARGLTRRFDVSPPWLNRVLARQPRRILNAVSDVDFDIAPGATFALVGESGSGKSTIARMTVGLLPPSAGAVMVDGVDLHRTRDAAAAASARSRIQMIFQDPFASLNPRWRVGDIVGEPLVAAGRADEARDRAAALLEQVGLAARDAEKHPHAFSGGQRQRIAIARALAASPAFIVCDEPTSALDVSVQAQVLNLMKDLQAELGLAYLFISHDLSVVRYMADVVGVLYLGRLVEVAPRDVLFADPKHPYTRMLLEAAPRVDGFDRAAPPPQGEIPDPVSPPSGCAFHPRCPLATDRCRNDSPQPVSLAGRRVACHAVS